MEQTINRGLDGIYIDESSICFIDGAKGQLIYSGYDIRELAGKASFEEVTYLLWHGELPTATELDAFQAELRANLELPGAVYDLFRSIPQSASPMHALVSAVPLLGCFDTAADGTDQANVHRIGLRLLAQMPLLAAAYQRVRSGQEPVQARADLGVAANFLYTLTGKQPTEAAARVMDVALVLHAEHGANASAFVGRATASTLTDVYSAITAAIAALKGPLHGGANSAVMAALEQIGSVDKVEQYVLDTLAKPGGRVMGFGHRVYRVLDPRARILQDVSRNLAEESGDSKWFEMSLEMERIMDREMDKKGKQVKPNVDFFSASVYRMLGFPTDMYTAIFVVARTAGWMAHLYEQYADNRIMRPRLVYTGETGKTFKAVAER